jgi:5'-nucleotidase
VTVISTARTSSTCWSSFWSITRRIPARTSARIRHEISLRPFAPRFDAVTTIEIGDLDRGYKAIDITGKEERLFSLSCPLYFAMIAVAIPKYTKGKLTLVAKNKAVSRSHRRSKPWRILAPARLTCCRRSHDRSGQCRNHIGQRRCAGDQGVAGDHGSPPRSSAKTTGGLPTIPVDDRAAEITSVQSGVMSTSEFWHQQACRPALAMSVAGGRPKVAVVRSNRR